MIFTSILFQSAPHCVLDEQFTAPEFLVDLNLDQIIAGITAGKEEYALRPFFYIPLHEVDAITWRHEIMQDLENKCLFNSIGAFAQSMHAMREKLVRAEKLYYKFQKERCFLEAVEIYCDAVTHMAHDLSAAEFASRGFLAFREYLVGYAASDHFNSLVEQTKRLLSDLSAIHYTVFIKGLRVQVHHYGGELDYSAEVGATFERFKQGAVEEYSFDVRDLLQMDHVEAEILDRVAKLHPEVFLALDNYCATNKDYLNDSIGTFDKEIQFYVAYLEYAARLKKAGLNFCYPRTVRECKEVYSYQSFDLALASKLIPENAAVVCNDFHLRDRERMIVVSGPNQGGKTTFARTFGQLHYLASLGCPVPGVRAQLFLFDNLFTHFEREENLDNLRGKLQDDLIRAHDILERATPESIIILNEIFTTTTVSDALLLSKKVAAKLVALDLLCIWVTFVEELASLGEQTVSMVSTVVPENPAVRTYKIIRRPADGLAYATAIAEKHRLSYSMIKERIG